MSLTVGCEWLGHCVGSKCADENDCDGDFFCINGVCGGETCSWEGHCSGTICSDFNDCSDDLSCNDGVCSYPEKKEDSATSSTQPTATPTSDEALSQSEKDSKSGGGLSAGAGAGIGVGITVLLILVGLALWLFFRRRQKRRQQEVEAEPEYDDDKGTTVRIINPGVSTEMASTPPNPAEIDSKPKPQMAPVELNADRSIEYAEIDSNPPRKYDADLYTPPQGAPSPPSTNFRPFSPGTGRDSPMLPSESGDFVSPVDSSRQVVYSGT